MENAIVFLAYAAVIIFSFIPTIKKKQPGEICAYALLLLLSAGLYILKVFITPDLKPISVFITNLIDKIANVR
jgi:hypothetical protein